MFGIVCTGSTGFFLRSCRSENDFPLSAMYFECFDFLGLTTTEDCAWSRSYKLLLLSLIIYRDTCAYWENGYSLNGI